jgi:hypothetical protein
MILGNWEQDNMKGPGIVTWSSGKRCNGETHYGHFNCKRVRRDGSRQQDILEDIHIQYENTPATWLAITVVKIASK